MCRKSIDRTSTSPQEFRRTFPLAALGEFLSDAEIETIVRQYRKTFRHRVFTPGLTVRAMVQRGLFPDRSIRALFAELAPHFPPGTDTPTASAFCQARARLPRKIWPTLIRRRAEDLERSAGRRHLFHGRPLYVVDGSSVSMPDTPSLRRAYGRASTRHGPSRFPVARLTLLLRHGTEAVVDYRLDRYRSSEDHHFQQMWDHLPSGSICLHDRKFGSFYTIAKLTAKGVDLVGRLHQRRDPERLIRAGRKIGRNEWIVPFRLAPQLRRRYNDPSLPEVVMVRLIRVCFRRGEHVHVLWLYTTLLDPVAFPRAQFVRLYRRRWGIETRFGSLKTVLKLNVLRSTTPAHVRSEVAATILAHTLVWTVIHQAVRGTSTPPDRVSFTGAVRTIVAFSPVLRLADEVQRVGLYVRMLRHIRTDVNLYRPNRIEPRLVKRDPVRYHFLMISRDEARQKCLS